MKMARFVFKGRHATAKKESAYAIEAIMKPKDLPK
jgi:hypothetical protein